MLTELRQEFVQFSGRFVRFLAQWLAMIEQRDLPRDRVALVVPRAGRLIATGDCYEPYRMAGPDGRTVEPVTEFFRDLLAAGRNESTVRSYGMDLLRWFRFCWAAGVAWDRVARADARDFSRWLQQGRGGKAFSPSVRAHSETVLRHFYGFCLDAGTGPVINPFPLDRSRRTGRAHAHHNPMEPYRNERSVSQMNWPKLGWSSVSDKPPWLAGKDEAGATPTTSNL
jgi:Phage integrase, N-terminal SAM-like domain